ncbi:gnat family acetyltransferase [Diaporthe amygdali]|uniref:gnat family acetyltransferase n=1 Tax=Phomopsis amygdali TaxID=1214568 RepID=UPI0022FE4C0E|nr:gnat family acetyltransferase [Diaporthe amygdali]KAJ0106953.1 gnat family acetyltransferase [Diaporthe amygdali]
MAFTVEKASLSDAKAIADIYQDRPVTAWNRLTHGTVDPSVFNAGLEDMFAESLQDPDEVLFLARDDDHPDRKVVSYVNLARKPALVPMTDEDIKQQNAKYHERLMPGLNGPLLLEMWEKLDRMREQVLVGKGDYWFLDNVGTLQAYQGRGIATMLLRKVLEEYPDREGVPIFLDTSGDEDGRAWPLYERLGFTKVGGFTIDLAAHGAEGVHTHLGMLREPQKTK